MPISSAFRKRLIVTKYTIPPLSPQRLQYFPCGILPPRTSFVFNCSVGSLSRTNPAQEECAGRDVEPRLRWRKEQKFSTGNNSL